MVNNSNAHLDVLFHALADTTRRGMLSRLADGEMSVKELAEPFDMSAPAISKHLKVLEKAGLLRREIEGRVHRCYLVPEAMDDAASWIAYYQQFWNSELDSLDHYLKTNKQDKERLMNDCAINDDYASLTIRRVFDADIETLFRAWTDPEILAKWFAPEGVTTHIKKVELETGGKYDFILNAPEGEVRHHGEYVLIEPPEKLVFTWVLDSGNQACTGSTSGITDTLVTVDFRRVDNGTEIVLTHEQLPDRKSCEGHQFGWTACFDSLAKLLG